MKERNGGQNEMQRNASLRYALPTHGIKSVAGRNDRQEERIILSRLAAKRLAQFFKEGQITDKSLIRKIGWIR